MKLHYKRFGEGQPIIILHGLMGMLDNWHSFAKLIAEAGFEVFIFDARNHGRSPHTREFSYPDMVNDLEEFIEEHTIQNPVIVGHSMGGKTAMLMAQKNPELLCKLVVVDISPREYPIHHEMMLEGLFVIDLKNISRRAQAEDILLQYVVDNRTRQFLLKNLYWNADKEMAWRFNLEVISKEIQTMGVEILFAQYNGPTLFIRGEKSTSVQAEDEEVIARAFPDGNIVTVPGAGHWVHADKPQQFLKELLGFIN